MKKRRLLLASCVAAALLMAGCKTTDVDTDVADGSGAASTSQVGTSTSSGSSSASTSTTTTTTTGTSSSGSSASSGQGSSSSSSQAQASSGKDYSADNEALWAAITAARQAALDAGADGANAAAFAAAEADYEAQRRIMEAGGSSEDMSAALRDLSYRYQGLTALANAQRKKAELDELGWASYNRNAYNSGSALVDELVNPLSAAMTGKSFFDKAVSAETDFDSVFTTAYRTIAKDERAKAFEAKKNADSVKAAVSRKADYDSAVTSFKNGDTHFVTGNPKGSIDDYIAAREAFSSLYEEISQARAQALAAIEAARKRVSESGDAAEAADREAPLGDSLVEGIEAEDAKLLDDDDFSDAEDAQAAAEDSIGEDVE